MLQGFAMLLGGMVVASRVWGNEATHCYYDVINLKNLDRIDVAPRRGSHGEPM